MTAVIGVYGNLQNVWLFSNCSILSIKNNLIKNGEVTSNAQCLSNIPAQNFQVSNINFDYYQPGQLWNLDQQCQMSMSWPDSSASSCGVDPTFCSTIWCLGVDGNCYAVDGRNYFN